MIPPTSIDGTDITGATIDGTDVTEITVDGQTVFSAAVPQPPSGVAYYTLDDADTSGTTVIDIWNGNDATNSGATTGASGANQTYTTNESYSFDASNDFIELPFSTFETVLGPEFNFSVSLWVFVTGSSNSDRVAIFHKNTSDVSSQFSLIFDRNNSKVTASTFDGSIKGGAGFSISEVAFFNDWYNVIYTYDSSTENGELYVNNTLGSAGGLISSGAQNSAVIGARSIGQTDPAHIGGRIDDVRIYDKTLSSTEVSNLYNTGSIL